LLIVDVQNSNHEKVVLEQLLSITNWEKLIMTRSHLNTIPSIKLPRINYNDAKEVYLLHCSKEKINNSLFRDFFEYIDYNILVIELTAKTIQNSIDLTLKEFLLSMKNQCLDSNEFNIDIDIRGENTSIRIFNFLIKKFAINNLESEVKYYLDFLVLLPSNNIVIEELILINGVKLYDDNKVYITNFINSLEKNGLLEYSSDRKRINIHKIIQEVVVYKERRGDRPFISSLLYICWLTHRIKEGYNDPNKSFKYLKYAESILNTIKEEYRNSIYQPMLILENELLFSRRFYVDTKTELTKLINLVKRAEKYFSIDNNNLGVMYNNLGLSYLENNEDENATLYLKKALRIFKKDEANSLNLIITLLNNLSNIYLLKNDLNTVVDSFNEVQKIRKKYKLYDDQQVGIEFRILSKSYEISGDYEKGIELLKSGIQLHKSIEESKRNDFYLSGYYKELSGLYLLMEDINQAIDNIEIGIGVLEKMNLNNSEYLFSMYKIALSFYQFEGLDTKEKLILEKINSFHN